VPRRILFVAALAAGPWCALPQRRAAVAADAPAPAAAQGLKWVGVGSCSSMGCHNVDVPKGTPGREYATWVTLDPHARAYLALYKEQSKQIEKNLKKLATRDEAKPEENPLCIKCHGERVPPEHRGPQFSVNDGVSCES